MQVCLTSENFSDLLKDVAQQTCSDLQENEQMQYFQFPEQLGSGSVQRLRLRPGFYLTLERMELKESLKLLAADGMATSSLDICFCLSGQVQGQQWSGDWIASPCPNRCCLGFSPEIRGFLEYAPTEVIQLVNISIDLAELPHISHTPVEKLPLPLKRIVQGTAESSFMEHCVMPVSSQLALHQIMHCPYQGVTRHLYLESRAIELLAHLFQQLAPTQATGKQRLSAEDIERIYAASDILRLQLEYPPSLLELARQVGLNDYKLKRGFREVFDTTAFGYLWSARMEQAALMLGQDRRGVTEVAHAVGYSSSTSFSAAFKRKFGTSPQQYRQNC